MSTDQIITSGGLTYKASADLSASQYCAVDVNSDDQVALPSAGGRIVGVLYSKPTAQGEACEVMPLTAGKIKIKAGGSFSAGDNLKVAATGKFVSASADDVAAGSAVAVARKASTGDGQVVEAVFGKNAPVAVSGLQTLAGAGAVDADTLITDWVATTDNATMDDGKYVGQRKIVRGATGTTGSNVLTPDTVSADAAGGTSPSSVTYTAEGQETEWLWLADGWKLVRIQAAGVETVAASGTANPLVAIHNLAVDGTDDAILPSGYYPGQESMWWVISAANVPVQTISGLFYLEDGSATGIDIDLGSGGTPAEGDFWRGVWTGARWKTVAGLNADAST